MSVHAEDNFYSFFYEQLAVIWIFFPIRDGIVVYVEGNKNIMKKQEKNTPAYEFKIDAFDFFIIKD